LFSWSRSIPLSVQRKLHYHVHIPVTDEYSPYLTPPLFWQHYNAVLYYPQLGNSQSSLSCYFKIRLDESKLSFHVIISTDKRGDRLLDNDTELHSARLGRC